MTDTISSVASEHAERIEMLEEELDDVIVSDLPGIQKAVDSLVKETKRRNEILEWYCWISGTIIAIIGLNAIKPVIVNLLNN